MTGNAPPATGWTARPIVMVTDDRDDLCTGTALAPDLVLTAAHCVTRLIPYDVKAYQNGQAIKVRSIAPQDTEGCGGLTALTPLLNYRTWILDTARKFDSPIAP